MTIFSRYSFVFLLTCLIPFSLAFSQGATVNVGPDEGIVFLQQDFPGNTPPVLDSSVGLLDVNLILLRGLGGIDSGFVNVIIDNNWVVRNLVILPEVDYPYSKIAIEFDLGVAEGTDVTTLDAEVIYSEDVQQNAPFAPAQTFDVGTRNISSGGFDGGFNNGGSTAPPNVIDINFTGPFEFRFVSQLHHPNIEAAKNQCFPMAIANSLQFLENTTDLEVPHSHVAGLNDNSLVGQIEQAMGRNAASRRSGDGVGSLPGLQGKLKYLADNNLQDRIMTRHFGSDAPGNNVGDVTSVTSGEGEDAKTATSTYGGSTIDHEEIIKSLARGENCEAGYLHSTGGHFVDITSAGVTNGVPWINEVSDMDQDDDTKGAGADGARHWQLKDTDNDGDLNMGGKADQELAFVICQKYVPPPPPLPPFIYPPFTEGPILIQDVPVQLLLIDDPALHIPNFDIPLPPDFVDIQIDPLGLPPQIQILNGVDWLPLGGQLPLPLPPDPALAGIELLTQSLEQVVEFPNIQTDFQMFFTPDLIQGPIIVGANGGLPGGIPTIFDVQLLPPGPPGSLWPWFDPLPLLPPPPIPLFLANGFSDQLQLPPFEPLQIGLSLDMFDQELFAEVWVVVRLDEEVFSYDLNSGSFLPGLFPSAQGVLFDVPYFPLLTLPEGLPPLGPIDLFFGIDTNVNGVPSTLGLELMLQHTVLTIGD